MVCADGIDAALFQLADRAPAGPEVQQQGLAAIVLQADGLAIEQFPFQGRCFTCHQVTLQVGLEEQEHHQEQEDFQCEFQATAAKGVRQHGKS